ncbi:MAG: hypothetical protein ACYDCS_04165 [Candidatus Dormibacteria bacterium]
MKRLIILAGAGIAALGAVLTTSASPPKQGLTVSPSFVSDPGDGPGGCLWNGNAFVCHVTLANPSSSNEKVPWVLVGGDVADNGSGFYETVSPSNGTLAPGKSVRVTITTNACGGYYAVAEFAGGSNYQYGGAVLYACG